MAETAAVDPGQHLVDLFVAGLRAVNGRIRVRKALQAEAVPGPLGVIALGKAAHAMCLGALEVVGSRVVQGLLVVPPEDAGPVPAGFRMVTGSHPLPDERSFEAGEALLDFLGRAPGTLLFLVSGGSSSLAEVPAPGVSRADLCRAHAWLLGSGLPIASVNTVRTRLSAIKGGGLLAHMGQRRGRALILSDVPGNDPAVVGSGPVVQQHAHALPDELPEWLRKLLPPGPQAGFGNGADGAVVDVRVIGAVEDAVHAVMARAQRQGLAAHNRGQLTGDAAKAGRRLVALLKDAPPGIHVWGGETTVVLPETPGYGGRNQQLALTVAVELAGRDDIWLLAAGTDGRDGGTSHAGAVVDGTTVGRAARAGMDVAAMLAAADAGTVFERLGDALVTGATDTNVMDLVIALKQP